MSGLRFDFEIFRLLRVGLKGAFHLQYSKKVNFVGAQTVPEDKDRFAEGMPTLGY
jgi:hypothetical protein